MSDTSAPFNFAPASPLDDVVHGSCRPGVGRVQSIPPESVEQWVSFMKQQQISRVLVLLHTDQLTYYREDLLAHYRREFCDVTWAPIADFSLPEPDVLQTALAALDRAQAAGEKIVVHCSAGMGRTGIVLAAWLIRIHGLDAAAAAALVVEHGRQHGATRVPTEAPGAMPYLSSIQVRVE